jgi:hypothetical protein
MIKLDGFIQICRSMKYKVPLALMIAMTLSVSNAIAQKAPAPDSLMCAHLNDFIRCVSMKKIFAPVGKNMEDSDHVDPFTPAIRLSRLPAEKIAKENNKVTYQADLFLSPGLDKKTETQLDKCHAQIKSCLLPWDDARLSNRDKSIPYQDYFMTNSEDETTVRIGIVRDSVYRVRITIY